MLKKKKKQEKILKDNYDNSTTEHSGFKKTLRRIKRKYYWNEIIENIKKHVQEYIKCQ